MGTQYSIRFRSEKSHTGEIKQRVDRELNRIENLFSTYRPASEISKINRTPVGERIPLSTDFATVLRFALALHEKTGGAFDPALGVRAGALGYGPGTKRKEYGRNSFETYRIDEATVFVWKREGALDLNAIVEGFALKKLLLILVAEGASCAIVEIGGDILTKCPWPVKIEGIEKFLGRGPITESETLLLADNSISTSGVYRQYKPLSGQGGYDHHIINPKSGFSSETKILQVSVLGPDSMTTDGLATSLVVMGLSGLVVFRELPEYSARLIIMDRGRTRRVITANWPNKQVEP